MEKYRQVFGYIAILFVICCMVSCYEDSDFPVSVGSGTSGVFPEGPINAGKKFGMPIGISAASFVDLENIEIEVDFPPELKIETISQPENFAKGAVHDHKLKWTGNIKQTFFTGLFSLPTVQRCDLWFTSTTNWEKWSKPIEIHIRLHSRLSRPRVPFPESTYKKTITWSHKGYSDPSWEIIPDKPNSRMK